MTREIDMIKNLSKITGIPIEEFNAALHLSKCTANTAAQAKKVREHATLLEDIISACIRWEELSLFEAGSAKNAIQAKKAFDDSFPGSEGERLAFVKADDFSLELVNNANTIPEIEEALRHAPAHGKAMKAGGLKIAHLSNNIEELVKIREENTKPNSKERMMIDRRIWFFYLESQ